MRTLIWVRHNHRLVEAVAVWLLPTMLVLLAIQFNDVVGGSYLTPSTRFWLGTGAGGVPIARQLFAGACRSLLVAALVTLPALILGFLLGGAWAIRRDSVVWRMGLGIATLVFLGPTPLLLTLAVLFGLSGRGDIGPIVLAIAIVAWPAIALRVRNEILSGTEEGCIRHARSEGAGTWDLLINEHLPLVAPVLAALGVLTAVSAIATEATVGYLGAIASKDSLGVLLSTTREAFSKEKYGAVLNLLLSVGGTLVVIIGGLRLLQAWADDRRVTRAIPDADGSGESKALKGPGWVVSVCHGSTGKPITAKVGVPHLPGKLLVISGGSGCGKSVTVHAMAGSVSPGLRADVENRAPLARDLRLVPQGLQDVFAANRTVNEYRVAAGLSEHEMTELLDSVGLNEAEVWDGEKRGKLVRAMSGGMAQRLAVGLLTRCSQPDVLLLDEPVSALDADNAARIGHDLRHQLKECPELAVIVVNHKPDWTRAFADHVVYLHDGRTVWDGAAQALGTMEPATAPGPMRPYVEAIRELWSEPAVEAQDTTLPSPRNLRIRAEDEAPILKVNDLEVRHPGAKEAVFSGISLTQRAASITALTAPSGGGKSTFLLAIAGLITPERGSVRVFGRAPDPDSVDFRRRLQLCNQNPTLALNPYVSVRKILTNSVRRRRLAASRAEAATLVEQACRRASFPLSALHKTPRELSGGLRVRAGLARALLGDVKILLADEITAGLDPEVALVVLRMLRELAEHSDLAVLVAAHDSNQIRYLGARVLPLPCASPRG